MKSSEGTVHPRERLIITVRHSAGLLTGLRLYSDLMNGATVEELAKCFLLEFGDNKTKYVLTADDFAGGNYEGIRTMHVADFLLKQEF